MHAVCLLAGTPELHQNHARIIIAVCMYFMPLQSSVVAVAGARVPWLGVLLCVIRHENVEKRQEIQSRGVWTAFNPYRCEAERDFILPSLKRQQ